MSYNNDDDDDDDDDDVDDNYHICTTPYLQLQKQCRRIESGTRKAGV